MMTDTVDCPLCGKHFGEEEEVDLHKQQDHPEFMETYVSGETFNPSREEVLDYVRSNPYENASDIVKGLGWDGAEDTDVPILSLYQEGKLRTENGGYVVADESYATEDVKEDVYNFIKVQGEVPAYPSMLTGLGINISKEELLKIVQELENEGRISTGFQNRTAQDYPDERSPFVAGTTLDDLGDSGEWTWKAEAKEAKCSDCGEDFDSGYVLDKHQDVTGHEFGDYEVDCDCDKDPDCPECKGKGSNTWTSTVYQGDEIEKQEDKPLQSHDDWLEDLKGLKDEYSYKDKGDEEETEYKGFEPENELRDARKQMLDDKQYLDNPEYEDKQNISADYQKGGEGDFWQDKTNYEVDVDEFEKTGEPVAKLPTDKRAKEGGADDPLSKVQDLAESLERDWNRLKTEQRAGIFENLGVSQGNSITLANLSWNNLTGDLKKDASEAYAKEQQELEPKEAECEICGADHETDNHDEVNSTESYIWAYDIENNHSSPDFKKKAKIATEAGKFESPEECPFCKSIIHEPETLDWHMEQEHGAHVSSQFTQTGVQNAMADANFDRLDDYYGEVRKILATEDEYMPDKWDYNEWYYGNNWAGMSKAMREMAIDTSSYSVDKSWANKDNWLDIPEDIRKKINYVGYSPESKAREGHWVSSQQEVVDWWDGNNDFSLRRFNNNPEAERILDSMNDDVTYNDLNSSDKDKVKQLYHLIGESRAREVDRDCDECGGDGYWDIPDRNSEDGLRQVPCEKCDDHDQFDTYDESKAKEISRPITDKEAMLMYDKPWNELTHDEKLIMHGIFADESKANEDYIPAPYDQHFEWVASMDQDDYRCKHCGKWMYWDSPQGSNALHTAPVHEIIPIVRDHLATHGITESYASEVSYDYNDIGGEKRKVTFTDNTGNQKTGRAVMKGPAGWVVSDPSEPHGGNGRIVDEGNFISVESKRKAKETVPPDNQVIQDWWQLISEAGGEGDYMSMAMIGSPDNSPNWESGDPIMWEEFSSSQQQALISKAGGIGGMIERLMNEGWSDYNDEDSYESISRITEEEDGWGDNWGDPEETAKDIYDLGHPKKIIPLTSTGMAEEPQDEDNKAEEEVPEEKWDKDDDIGRNYAEPTGDDEPLDDDSYWQGRDED